jgi:hypothetical protein
MNLFKPLKPKIVDESDQIIDEFELSKEYDKDDNDVDYDERVYNDIPIDD